MPLRILTPPLLLAFSLAYNIDAFVPASVHRTITKLVHLSSLNTNAAPVPPVNHTHEKEESTVMKRKSVVRKVADGLKVAPAVATLPLYGLGFGILGPKHMWKFSKWIYGLTNPSDSVLHAHFDRLTGYLYSGKEIASRNLVSYRVHLLFAGLSLISTAVLAFAKRSGSTIMGVMPYNQLLFVNMLICFISAIAAFPLHKIMIGNLNAKKWILVQGYASMVYTTFSLCPGRFGRLMVHLNWAVLFGGGFLERVYILCVMSQLHIPDRKTYLRYYSPQIKGTTLGGIPLGILTFLLFA